MNITSIPSPSAGPSARAAVSLGLHLHAVLTACATLFLIFVGALVTSHDAGLAVPDWPTTYDENMFLYPPARWVGGIFYEHGHRLTATAVGLLTLILALRLGLSETAKRRLRVWVRGICIALAALSLLRLQGERLGMSIATTLVVLLAFEGLLRGAPEQRRWVRRLGYLALGAVCLQGLLGGLTVRFMLPLPISVAHGCLAQAFLCLTITLGVVTSPGWIAFEATPRFKTSDAAPWRLFALTAGVVYLQLVAGAVMRHMNAGLAIPDFPLAFGRLIPPLESVGVLVHFLHRVGAIFVTLCVLASGASLLRQREAGARLKGLTVFFLLLLATQLTLGAFTIWTKTAPLPTSFHVATGAALLGTSVLLGLLSYQRLAPSRTFA